MKIIGITDNYGDCQAEHRDLFLMPDSSLVKGGKPVFLPDADKPFAINLSIALSISKVGKKIAPRFAYRYFNAASIAVNFIDMDAWREVKAHGGSWAWSRAFDGSVAISEPVAIDTDLAEKLSFTLKIDNDEYTWDSSNMRMSIADTLSWVSQRFTFKMGDLYLIGLSAHFIDVKIGQHIEGFINDKKILEFNIK